MTLWRGIGGWGVVSKSAGIDQAGEHFIAAVSRVAAKQLQDETLLDA